jgi:FMN phosphatase YigB (HAD superfamily)
MPGNIGRSQNVSTYPPGHSPRSGDHGKGRKEMKGSPEVGRTFENDVACHNPNPQDVNRMALPSEVVFLLDVDNTLLDNDRVQADLRDHLACKFGVESRDRYWAIFEELRVECGYADYLGALQRYRLEDLCDPRLLLMSSFLVDYPFGDRLYPGSLDAVKHLGAWGPVVILSDGDVVFQPRKVQRSGLWETVEGRVLIYIHKEEMLDDVERHYPARHYVMVDDKLRILAAMQKIWGDRVTTVWIRQGHYALDPQAIAAYPPADLTIERIGDLFNYSVPALLGATKTDVPHDR